MSEENVDVGKKCRKKIELTSTNNKKETRLKLSILEK